MRKSIVIFASGSGTNAENIIRHFKTSPVASVDLVLTNKEHAGVRERAEKEGVPCEYFPKQDLYETEGVIKRLREIGPDLIVLAGFLLKFPELILAEFPNKVINIHPALLPNYGGKGMYGRHVHEAVIANKEPETGITIHYVNEKYDDGAIIFQARIPLAQDETPDSVATKIHDLEHRYFPEVIENILTKESDG